MDNNNKSVPLLSIPPLNAPITRTSQRSAPPHSSPKQHTEPESIERLTSQLPTLRQQVESLNTSLCEVNAEEAELTDQLKSLKYAFQLTTSEVERRHRANTELHTVYNQNNEADQREQEGEEEEEEGEGEGEGGENDDDERQMDERQMKAQHDKVQTLEVQLLNEKRDAANLIYEVETLQSRLKKLTETIAFTNTTVNNNNISTTPKSPNITINNNNNSKTNSPTSTTPHSLFHLKERLIADVDCLMCVNDNHNEYVACRLGVSTSGHVAIYSYASAIPVIHIESMNFIDQQLSTKVLQKALVNHLYTCDILASSNHQYHDDDLEEHNNSNNSAQICGLKEAVRAAVQLMQDSNQQTAI